MKFYKHFDTYRNVLAILLDWARLGDEVREIITKKMYGCYETQSTYFGYLH
jgi:hypothetical protein